MTFFLSVHNILIHNVTHIDLNFDSETHDSIEPLIFIRYHLSNFFLLIPTKWKWIYLRFWDLPINPHKFTDRRRYPQTFQNYDHTILSRFQELLRLESAWHKAVCLAISQLGSKTFHVVYKNKPSALTLGEFLGLCFFPPFVVHSRKSAICLFA